MLLLLRFFKSGKVYFIRGHTENGGLDIPFSLVASEKYEARMLELDTETASLRTFSIKGVSNILTFTTSLTVEQLERLQEMAEEFISLSQSKYHHLKHFYRNKPPPYFGDIFYNHNGVMKPYLKDHNGDQLSPINGKLNGLFFSASVKFSTGKVPSTSCFGAKRLYVPAEVLFDGNTCLYFTDFYCTSSRGPHYVTLVMTRKGSEADRFCQTRLRQLNPFNNPFLYKKNCSYGWQVFTCTCSVCLNIEVFYTENVDIKWLLDRHRNNAYFENVETFGQGHSSLMGIPKNTKCKVCNLQLGSPLKRQPK
ncbi:phytanoyl-CoA hydroxylase-interacting protein-like [Haliotis rubra]|uniref:phytanoyl-CoA hydroxylase-interacting protein-like n=1 Tax=Haliotis rubra TaxID=36100 RepID=UPI001EE60528|nr:phytanoyl-CoA hydroxylase-interacting protein-like [Haliotis rubra]